MNKRLLPVAIGIIGILFFSTKAVFVKLAYAYGIASVPLLTLRMVFSLPFYIATLAFMGGKSNNTTRKDLLWIFLFGFLGYYLASFLDFQGLKYIKASVERLILFIYPSLVLLLSALFLKQKATKIQVIALAISYIGILFVFVPEVEADSSSNTLLGGVLVFLSGLSYASYIVGSGWLIPKLGATRFTTYCMLVSCSLVILHFFLQGGTWDEIINYPYQVYVITLLMAVISTVVPSYFVSIAIKGLGANQFAIFGSLGPVSTIVLAYFFLEETLSTTQFIGGLVVVAGVMAAEKFKSAKGS
ncbi:MAG: DMT family transporter [Cytophagales bacterium]|nr:DMT family transporter [Cytophagales bacterium]